MKRRRLRLTLPETLTFTAITIATLGGPSACSSRTQGGGSGGKAATGGAGGNAATGGAAGSGGCSSEAAFFCVSLSPDAGCPMGAVCNALDCPTGCHPESA